jgi:hypothetical protein
VTGGGCGHSCDLVWGGEGNDLSAYQVVPNFRVRTIPVLGPIPAVFGMAAAAYVLTELAQQPIVSEPIYPLKMDQYETLYHRLMTRAEERWGAPRLPQLVWSDAGLLGSI